ncbi:sigma 54-interacting transcriptional regulator [Fusibacter paucivorans]|uniref:HTH-type transcriptional regulatory protein TyrR n=1 Tax=Fusibacter paucivorans TaxID=76009 RepID=A0ABS5PRL9_9FIRM|nr:sigma 54-interacting transcriptional regulator [Fusibacter paucivorans]MBS7527813.1 sigma 54-interacting transcriptional regulator [Fusibacter paucivorans]
MEILLEDVLDAIDDPAYVLNCDGSFVFANKALIKVTGYSRKEFYELNVFDMEQKGRISPLVTRTVIRTKQKVIACQHVTHKNEIVSRFMITQSPIFDANGDVIYLVGLLKDVKDINVKYQKALENSDVSIFRYRDEQKSKSKSTAIIAESDRMKKLLNQAKNLASVDTSVLLLGESGTGKEVISSFIHEMSPRSDQQMIKINCASLPESLLEAELFGYEKGSFTGALDTGKIGLFELAHGGTLFLDEIDAMPLATQGKLLRVLESKMIKKIGSIREQFSDFRLITATNADLEELVAQKRFRQDLYFRLNVVPLKLPPLREHSEDIIPLGQFYIQHYCQKYNKNKQFSQNVFNIMRQYQWPGNVRELKNFVERMVVMTQTAVIELNDVPEGLLADIESRHQRAAGEVDSPVWVCEMNDKAKELFDLEHKSYKELMDAYEAEIIKYAMRKYGTTYRAAEVLGVNQSTIHRKHRKLIEGV